VIGRSLRRRLIRCIGRAGAAWIVFGAALVASLTCQQAHAAEERPVPAQALEDEALRAAVAHAWQPSPTGKPPAPAPNLDPQFRAALAVLDAMARPTDAAFLNATRALEADELLGPALQPAARRALGLARQEVIGEGTERLRHDARFNQVAGVFNTVAGAFLDLLQGDATVFARVTLSIGRAFGFGRMVSRERAELEVLRRHTVALREKDPRGRLDPLTEKALAARENVLAARRAKEMESDALGVLDEALTNERFFEARGWVMLLPAAARPEAGERIAAAEASVLRRSAAHLRVDPANRLAVPNERRLILGILLDGALPRLTDLDAESPKWQHPVAALSARRKSAYNAERAALLAAGYPLARWELGLFPDVAAEHAEALEAARIRYYVVRGRRAVADNAYLALYGAAAGPVGAVSTGILFGLDAALRGVAVWFRRPFAADDLASAAMVAANSPVLPIHERAKWLARAAEIHRQAGLADRALALQEVERPRLGLGEAPRELLAELSEEAANTLVRRAADDEIPLDRRRALLVAAIDRYPSTPSAVKAKERLDALPPATMIEARTRSVSVVAKDMMPGGPLGSWPGRLRLPSAWLDGDPKNGELKALRVTGRPAELRLELAEGESRIWPIETSQAEELEDSVRALVHALASDAGYEARFRRQLLPIGVEGGFGGGGFDFQPRLKEIPYRAPDAHLYRDAQRAAP